MSSQTSLADLCGQGTWRTSFQSYLNLFSAATRRMKDPRLCDVFFVARGQRLGGHRALLAASSVVFASMLFSDDEAMQIPVEIDLPAHIDPKNWSILIESTFVQNVSIPMDRLESLLQLATEYSCPRLAALCLNKLTNSITLATAFKQFEISQIAMIDNCDAITHFIDANFSKLLPMPEFLNLSPSNMVKILASNHLQAEEDEILSRVIAWTQRHPKHAADAIHHIRVLGLSPKAIATSLAPLEIFTDSQILALYEAKNLSTNDPDRTGIIFSAFPKTCLNVRQPRKAAATAEPSTTGSAS